MSGPLAPLDVVGLQSWSSCLVTTETLHMCTCDAVCMCMCMFDVFCIKLGNQVNGVNGGLESTKVQDRENN